MTAVAHHQSMGILARPAIVSADSGISTPRSLQHQQSQLQQSQSSSARQAQTGDVDLDKQLKTAVELIQDAFERRTASLVAEVNQWKHISNAQRQQARILRFIDEASILLVDQINLLESENRALLQRASELERVTESQAGEIKALQASKLQLQERHSQLKKSAMQLESFRKNIVSMVEYGPTLANHVLDLETSFVEPNISHETVTRRATSPHSPSRSGRTNHHVTSQQPSQSNVIESGKNGPMDSFREDFEDPALRSFEISAQSLDYSLGINPSEKSFLVKTAPSFSPKSASRSRPDRANPPQIPPSNAQRTLEPSAGQDRWTSMPALDPSYKKDDNSSSSARNEARWTTGVQDSGTPTPAGSGAKASFLTARSPSKANAVEAQPAAPIDAPTLYKQIRDTLTATEFEEFAANVAAFNSSDQTADETVRNIGRLVKDRALFAQMKALIFTALAESARSEGGK